MNFDKFIGYALFATIKGKPKWDWYDLKEADAEILAKKIKNNIYIILRADDHKLICARPHDVVPAVRYLNNLPVRNEDLTGEPHKSTQRLITMLECCRFDRRPMDYTAEADLLNAIAGLKNILKYM